MRAADFDGTNVDETVVEGATWYGASVTNLKVLT